MSFDAQWTCRVGYFSLVGIYNYYPILYRWYMDGKKFNYDFHLSDNRWNNLLATICIETNRGEDFTYKYEAQKIEL